METGPRVGSGRLRIWITAAWLVVFSNGALFFVGLRLFDRGWDWEGPIVRPAILLSTGLGVALVLLDGQRLSGQRLRRVAAVPFVAATAFGVWATVTTFWSVQPDITLWRGVGYTFLPCVAWVIADLSAQQWRRALAIATGFLVGAGLLVVAVRPQWGTDINDDWRGLMTNRNGFGPICAMGVIAGVSMFVEGRRRVGALLVGAGFVGLLGTGSRTAWLAIAVGLGVATVVVVGRRAYLARPTRAIVVGATGTFVGGLAVVVGGVAMLWNESTFAQRRTIWDLVGDHIADAPIIGNGWAAFWYRPDLHTDPLLQRGSAHAAVPELLLGGGVILLVLWLIVVGYAVVGVGREAWQRPGNEAWLWLALVTFLLVENLTESFVLWFSYNWILLIAAALRYGRARRAATLRTPDLAGLVS